MKENAIFGFVGRKLSLLHSRNSLTFHFFIFKTRLRPISCQDRLWTSISSWKEPQDDHLINYCGLGVEVIEAVDTGRLKSNAGPNIMYTPEERKNCKVGRKDHLYYLISSILHLRKSLSLAPYPTQPSRCTTITRLKARIKFKGIFSQLTQRPNDHAKCPSYPLKINTNSSKIIDSHGYRKI